MIRRIRRGSRDFVKGIKNLYRWLPVVWKDRDWGHFYFYTILETKLSHMADYFEKYGIGLSSEEDAKLMRECVKLIKDIKDHTAINFVEEELSQDKKRVLFDTIKENINGWWD